VANVNEINEAASGADFIVSCLPENSTTEKIPGIIFHHKKEKRFL